MRRTLRITAPDVVACLPLLSFGVLMFFGFLAYLQVGHWPQYSRPDPKELALGGVPLGGVMFLGIILAILGTIISAGATAFHTLLVLLSDLVDARRELDNYLRILGRLGFSLLGFALFWTQLGSMMSWLMD